MKIMPNRMDRGYYKYQKEFEEKTLEVLRSGWYVLGNEVKSFEEEFAEYNGAKFCVGLASGLDALWIAFKVLGIVMVMRLLFKAIHILQVLWGLRLMEQLLYL